MNTSESFSFWIAVPGGTRAVVMWAGSEVIGANQVLNLLGPCLCQPPRQATVTTNAFDLAASMRVPLADLIR